MATPKKSPAPAPRVTETLVPGGAGGSYAEDGELLERTLDAPPPKAKE